ncbi:hypothetical protein BKA01_005512 [Pseudonocardia eucalypti]|uniref:SAM-dependent methyltransferase n=1 Tax=Pseudonocardia eucalypti TaxID=648755 RepID=UPI0016074F81|nr:hypothetical protein [Pseudonocardia eucalypti]
MVEAAGTPSAQFAVRVLRYLAAEAGVRQFLELSLAGGPEAGGPKAGGPKAGGPKAGGPKAGGPKAGGPEAGGPETGGPETGGLEAGEVIRRIAPEALVARPDGERDARRIIAQRLDPGRQVAVLWLGAPPRDPATGACDGSGVAAVIAGVMAAVPSGSYLALCCADPRWMTGRLTGLALVEPGLVPVTDWRPDYPPAPVSGPVTAHGALARKP